MKYRLEYSLWGERKVETFEDLWTALSRSVAMFPCQSLGSAPLERDDGEGWKKITLKEVLRALAPADSGRGIARLVGDIRSQI